MNRVYLFFLLISLEACVGHTVNFIQEPYTSEQAVLKKRLEQIFAFGANKNFKELEAAHLYGPKFTKFDDWEPLTRQDAETAKKGEKEAFMSVKDFAYSIHDFKADVFGKIAVTTFSVDYGMQLDKDKIKAKARATIVFIKDGNDWKITHEHFSPFKANP